MVIQNLSLLLSSEVTEKPCFELSHKSNSTYNMMLNFNFKDEDLNGKEEVNRCKSQSICYVN